MHYLLGLAALVMGAVIATRRTRPAWFVVTTSVLVAIGALLAILSYLRVTDPMGLVANSILGWVFVGFSITTMLSAIFVLERRGAHGEELPPLIGDNPFDGDTDDSDDPEPGTRSRGFASVTGAAAAAGAAGAAAAGSPGSAGVGAAGTEAFAEEAAGARAHGLAAATPEEEAMTDPDPNLRAGDPVSDGGAPMPAGNAAMETGLRASLGAGGGDPGAHTDERPAEEAHEEPVAHDGAEDGTSVLDHRDPDVLGDRDADGRDEIGGSR